MIRGVRFVIKDKLAFIEENGLLRYLGKPLDLIKTAKEELIHIKDLNALKGSSINLDIYDKITYEKYLEVEVAAKENIIKKLIEIEARVIVSLPCIIDLEKYSYKKRLLVGKTDGDKIDERVFDYYIESEDKEKIKNFVRKVNKRVFVFSNNIESEYLEKIGVFAHIKNYNQ